MPTPLDRAMQSKAALWTFAGAVGAAAAWSIWGPNSMFPQEPDPKGDPETWSENQLRAWLSKRGLFPDSNATREQLLERVKANMRPKK